MQQKSKTIIYRITHTRLVQCFGAWGERAREQITMRHKSTKIIHRITDACLVKCFELWHENTRQKISMHSRNLVHRTRNLVMKTLDHNNSVSLQRCVDLWHTCTFDKRMWRAKAARLRNCVIRAILSRSLETWRLENSHIVTGHEKQTDIGLERLKDNLVRKLMSSARARLYNGWFQYYVRVKRQRFCSLRIRHRLARAARAGSFRFWRRCTMLQLRISIMRTRIVSRVPVLLRLDAWEIHARRQRYVREVCVKVVAHMIRRRLAPVFDTWRSHTEAHNKIRFTVSSIAKQWSVGKLAISFETWHKHAHQQVRGRGLLVRKERKWAMRSATAAFTRWQANAAVQRRGRKIGSRGVDRWSHGCLLGALQGWCDYHQEVRSTRMRESHQEHESALQVQRRKRGRLEMCVGAWAGVVRRRAWYERMSSLYSSKLLKTHVQHLMVHWCGAAMLTKRRRVVQARAVRCHRTRMLSRACLSWQDTVTEVKVLRSKAKKAVTRTKVRTCARSFGTWRHGAIWGRKSLQVLRWRKMQLMSAVLRTWRILVVDGKRSRTLAARIRSRSATGLRWRAWKQWEIHVVDMRAAKDRFNRTGAYVLKSPRYSNFILQIY